MQGIRVLVDEGVCLVAYCSSEVTDQEAFVVADLTMVFQL